jgi:hypothetical protein
MFFQFICGHHGQFFQFFCRHHGQRRRSTGSFDGLCHASPPISGRRLRFQLCLQSFYFSLRLLIF